MFLYEKINNAKEFGITADIPQFMFDNLSTNIKLRDYQKEALINTLIYLNGDLSKNKQTHILYHMATGSGKTVIMALDILYYYSLGYRKFLFFTNQTNIVSKTRINFLQRTSSKYLFSNNININGENVKIVEVENFEDVDNNAINICFNTVQGIHNSLSLIREGSLSIEDFEDEKIVLIADEAHHLNSSTSKDKNEKIDNLTWEDTVNRILYANKDNVLLEFTATCDLQDINVLQKYIDKIVFNFDLKEFRKAGYTKEFLNLQSNTSKWIRTLQSLIISEYRKLIFESNNISIKPVVLLKSKTISDSNAFYGDFFLNLKNLRPEDIDDIKLQNIDNPIFSNAFQFFNSINIDNESLVDMIKVDFAEEHTVNMNILNVENESIVNNLDEKNNHYRLIFIVDKLTEGWDVLSLFDIVRLYETRQGGSKGAVSKYTISEAQLIGRGARYCPFKFNDEQIAEKRKYSNYDNPLSICETLLYHCMQDSRYIDELQKALKQTGLLPDVEPIRITYKLKDNFKKSKTYLEGLVFLNKRIEINRELVTSLPEKIRTAGITYKCLSSTSFSKYLLDDTKLDNIKLKSIDPIFLKDIDYNILYKAFRCFDATLCFSKIKRQFPNLNSVEEFLLSNNYLGSFPITFFVNNDNVPSIDDKLNACKKVFQYISDYIQTIEITYKGTNEFYGIPIRDIFTDKIRNVTRDKNDESWGEGVSQNNYLVNDNYRLDLSNKDWYAYTDNYGTSEEKKFVKYFSIIYNKLVNYFDDIYLIRNELQASIYSFDDGSKFEPDYILILNKNNNEAKNLYICMFVEPKGEHLLEKDNWKNNFLNQLNNNSTPIITFIDDNDYRILGSPLYNEKITKEDFDNYLDTIIKTL